MAKYGLNRCVEHRGKDVGTFVNEYFSNSDRNCCIIAGAGFDPRAVYISKLLSSVEGLSLHGYYIKEKRPNPSKELSARADDNFKQIAKAVKNSEIIGIDIFSSDMKAILGGRRVAEIFKAKDYSGYTDIVVDLSALSAGTSFPLVSLLFGMVDCNLHLMVAADAGVDEKICSSEISEPDWVHGFKSDLELEGDGDFATLWLPQLSMDKKNVLQSIHKFRQFDDICPILPFPSGHPRYGDKLITEFMKEIEGEWKVDSRSILYAAENNPLDLYRTILRIDDERKKVFENFGNSYVVLSPTGSKMLSIGALMAAMERRLPVAYVETIEYDFAAGCVGDAGDVVPLLGHVWLKGDVY